MSLPGKTLFITGASRGIGREIALKAAADGANIVVAAKSAEAHPKLPGTIFSVAEEIVAAGGRALPIQLDVRDEEAVKAAMAQAAEHFGGIDALINNAGAIRLKGVEASGAQALRPDVPDQHPRGNGLQPGGAALPEENPGSYPQSVAALNLDPKWFASYGPYTTTKYGMSMLTLGMHEEFKKYGISVNALWPKTVIATAAIEFEAGGPAVMKAARLPAIMADAAYAILSSSGRSISGRLLIDEEILREQGQTDFEQYRYDPSGKLMTDLFVD